VNCGTYFRPAFSSTVYYLAGNKGPYINNQPEDLITKKMLRLPLYEMPGTVLVVLGLYGKFWAKGDAFMDFLNDQGNVNLILTIGIVIWLYCWTEFFKLMRNKH
jgi:hypothetical protein